MWAKRTYRQEEAQRCFPSVLELWVWLLFDQVLWLLMQKPNQHFPLTFRQTLPFYEGVIHVGMLQRRKHSKLNDQICMQSDTQVRLRKQKITTEKEFIEIYLRKYCSNDFSNSLSFFFPYKNFLFSISISAKCGPLKLLFSVSLCNLCTNSEALDIRESNCMLDKKLDNVYARSYGKKAKAHELGI